MSTHPPSESSANAGPVTRVALYLGAFAVVATGVAHLQQYYGNGYSTVPTIGTLFFLNFISAVVIAAGLVAPLRRVAGRYAEAARVAFAIGGIGLAALSLAGLFISERSGLFGFVEHGYRSAIVIAIVAEVAAIVFLVVFLLPSLRRAARRARAARPEAGRVARSPR